MVFVGEILFLLCHRLKIQCNSEATQTTPMGKNAGWTLVLEDPLPNKKRPDGTLKDSMTIPRGYWEAKDTKDDLDKEIKNKTFLQYPLVNTIFEDTRRAVLFQNGKQVGRIRSYAAAAINQSTQQVFQPYNRRCRSVSRSGFAVPRAYSGFGGRAARS